MSHKRSFQVKTRLRTPNFGKSGDLLYHTLSSSAYNFEAYSKETMLSNYEQYRALRTTQVSPVVYPSSFCEKIATWNGQSRVMRNCSHTKLQYVNLPYLLAHWKYTITSSNWTPYATEYLVRYYRRGCYTTIYTRAIEDASSHATINDQMFSARAYWSMRPKLQSSVSLINSIFELKDFSEAAQFIFSPRGAARAIAQNMKSLKSLNRAIGGGNSHKFKSPSNAIRKGYNALKDYLLSKPAARHAEDLIASASLGAAQATLTYNLAIMPTIRDVMAIHGEMQKNVYEQLRDFKAYGDEGARSHYSETKTLYSDITTGANNSYVEGAGKQITLLRTATMVSYYQILWQRFEDMYPKWWGLEVGADEVWNFLPLSFVLDYALTIGKSLEYMDRDPRIKILGTEYCESVKVTAELGYYLAQSYRTPHLIIDGKYIMPRSKTKYHLVSGTSGCVYSRNVMEPYKGPALPQLKLPSKTQTANMLALARCLLF